MGKKFKIIIGIISVIVIIIITISSGYLIIKKMYTEDENIPGQANRGGGYLGTGGEYGFSSKSDGISSVVSKGKSLFDSVTSKMPSTTQVTTEKSVGFSVGGAKNIENFRENIENGYFPISTDITYNGLFYDYYFETGESKNNENLFSPAYVTAVSKDPISGKNEYYMTVRIKF